MSTSVRSFPDTYVDSVAQLFRLAKGDVMIGILPFFPSFGYTGTIWFPLLTGFGAAYHPNPMDAKTIGDLTERHNGTILMSTPTFCASYIRNCEPGQFANLRYAVAGAEIRIFAHPAGAENLAGAHFEQATFEVVGHEIPSFLVLR